eukprot:Plantae.Rhodophyta-Purpureofilum_apyrenoidigerum.ctg21363.p1 GENE.Plantae.Rhodophyta-Purpureofilum_apyrenoidigerum.ctg21363~~Plantae.Rhodophyta-Purpureofilum_apyrenoidigerum.ctg21363.p1  ORF type:complete len:366 (+),score=53.55 Plantae.Rhodophyta-Purpureofilum_apyrenoidigerum.ctg21363:161-1258(+)
MVGDCEGKDLLGGKRGLAFAAGAVHMLCRFQLEAHTIRGENLVLIGSSAEMGSWDLASSIKMKTTTELYPMWWSPVVKISEDRVEYKYGKVRNGDASAVVWESSGSECNRVLERRQGRFVVHDFEWGSLQKYPFGFELNTNEEFCTDAPKKFPAPALSSDAVSPAPGKLKIAILGSSVARGCFAWNLDGWAQRLARAIDEKYGHLVLNFSETGANVQSTISRFNRLVAPQKPDIVVISLSLGNEGIFRCQPNDRMKLQTTFEKGIRHLVEKARALGCKVFLGGIYPNGNCTPETYWFLRDTHKNLRTFDVPVLEWLDSLDDGRGRWAEGISIDPAHPNSRGHQLMFEAIDLSLFADVNVDGQEKN